MKTWKAVIPAALAIVTLACGYSSKTSAPVAGTMPAITQLNPTSANAGGPPFMLTVNGTNFNSTAVVNWNGSAQTTGTTYVGPGQLTLAVPAAMIATSGTIQVMVTNPATQGTGMYGSGGTLAETSSAVIFTIN